VHQLCRIYTASTKKEQRDCRASREGSEELIQLCSHLSVSQGASEKGGNGEIT